MSISPEKLHSKNSRLSRNNVPLTPGLQARETYGGCRLLRKRNTSILNYFSAKKYRKRANKNRKISPTYFLLKMIDFIANFLSLLKTMTNLLKYSQKAPQFLVVVL